MNDKVKITLNSLIFILFSFILVYSLLVGKVTAPTGGGFNRNEDTIGYWFLIVAFLIVVIRAFNNSFLILIKNFVNR